MHARTCRARSGARAPAYLHERGGEGCEEGVHEEGVNEEDRAAVESLGSVPERSRARRA